MSTSLPMVGRAAERQALSAVYAHAVAGQSQVLVITGEAGIGKTRLAAELCAEVGLPAGLAQVRTGESAPLAGATLAYGPFVAALRDQAGWLLANDSAGDMLAARHRLFERMRGLLCELATESPLVLVLEDLHWADESSRQLLAFLAVRLREQPVMVMATLREEDLDSDAQLWLAELVRRPRVTRLRLTRLADAEVGQLIAHLLPTASAEHVAAVVRAAAGNPLYAQELASARPPWPPVSISEALVAKAASLAAPARAVVDQVCVCDGGMSHELLAATVRLPESRLLAAARAAVASRLLVGVDDRYAFPHALIRQVLYTHLLPGERRRLHRRVAQALAARDEPDAALLAQHWQLAGYPDRAGPAALLAARQAVSARAYPEADRFYALAMKLARSLTKSDPALLAEAAQAASWAGNPGRAATYVAEALEQLGAAGAADRARLLERLGRYRWEMGDPKPAIEATEQAVALLDADPPSPLQAQVLAALATRRVLLGELDEALPLAVRAVAAAKQVGAIAEHAHGLATLGIIQAQRGDLDGGLTALRTSFTLAHRVGSVEDVVRAAASRMYVLCTAGLFAEALDVAREGQQAASSLDAPPALTAVFDNNTAAVLAATGRWAEAGRLLAELVSESSSSATRYFQLLQLELAVGRGEKERVAELATAVAKSPDDPRLAGPLHACLAEHALNAGDLATAAGEVVTGLAALDGAALVAEEIRLLAAGARVAADLASLPHPARPENLPGQWEPMAASFADRARAIVSQNGGRQPDVTAFGALVAAEDARQHQTGDRSRWRAVADAWQVAGQPYREAYARLREAEAATRAGRREQATRALAACESLARELPAAPLLSLAQELARQARLTVPPASRDRSAAACARFGLTGREADVLALLSNGDSNRLIARTLFISERTVAVHVSHIFDKLGVRNRTQAATIGARLGLSQSSPPSRYGPNEEPNAKPPPYRG